VEANTTTDADRTAACRALVEPLRDAWREAATGGPATPPRDGVQVTA
jgi:flagellar protein FliS